jgi:ribosomal protein S18 acetylase RimI-like enzyme
MSAGGTEAGLRARIEVYCDEVMRPAADVEEHGALVLFVSRIPWRFCARPRLGAAERVAAADVEAMRARQRALGVPEAFEWVEETTPGMAAACAGAGLEVTRVPLLALAAGAPRPLANGVPTRMLEAGDAALAAAEAVIGLAFATPGTAVGLAGAPARDRALARTRDVGFLRDRIRRGLTRVAVAEDAGGPLAAGSSHPVADVAEITGVGTLPAARRRGLGAAVCGALVADALAQDVTLPFLSAADDDVSRLYRRLGFQRVGTACFGRPPGA